MKKLSIFALLLISILVLCGSAFAEETVQLNYDFLTQENDVPVSIQQENENIAVFFLPQNYSELPQNEGDINYFFGRDDVFHAVAITLYEAADFQDAFKQVFPEDEDPASLIETYMDPILVNGMPGYYAVYNTEPEDLTSADEGYYLYYNFVAIINISENHYASYMEVSTDSEDFYELASHFCRVMATEETTSETATEDVQPEADTTAQTDVSDTAASTNEVSTSIDTTGSTGQFFHIDKEGSVNLRSSSSTKGNIVGSAHSGETYPVLEIAKNGWVKIRIEGGLEGFVSPKMGTLIE